MVARQVFLLTSVPNRTSTVPLDMNINQVKSTAYGALQHYMEANNLPIAVGPISDNDWSFLERGFGELNWGPQLTMYGNGDEAVSLAFKLLPSQLALDGAVMGRYIAEQEVLEIHLIESFVRTSVNHPLHGTLFMFTMVFSFLFIRAIGGAEIRLVEPCQELLGFFTRFEFELAEIDGSICLTITPDKLSTVLGFYVD